MQPAHCTLHKIVAAANNYMIDPSAYYSLD